MTPAGPRLGSLLRLCVMVREVAFKTAAVGNGYGEETVRGGGPGWRSSSLSGPVPTSLVSGALAGLVMAELVVVVNGVLSDCVSDVTELILTNAGKGYIKSPEERSRS